MDPIKTAMLSPTASPIERIQPKVERNLPKAIDNSGSTAVPFSDLLEKRLDQPSRSAAPLQQELKFSAHAKARLNSRSIDLSADDLVKMQEAINRAGQKGSRESLILTDKAAFVVSVKNNTVITAVDRDSLKENIFTNIDSTIMI